MQGGDDRRHHGGDAAALGGPLVGVDVDERAQAELVGGDRDRRPGRRPSVAPVARASGSSTGSSDAGSTPLGGDGGSERGQLGGVGQVADGHEVPDLLEAVVAGELGGVVAAVVVEAGLAVDVADGGVGDGDAVEAGGYVDQGGHESIVLGSTLHDQR